MEKNLKKLLIKTVIFVLVLAMTRVLFQAPVEYFGLAVFKQNYASRLFSKIDALKIFVLAALFFILYFRDEISKIKHPIFNLRQSLFFLIPAELIIAGYYGVRAFTNIYEITDGMLLYASWAIVFVLFAAAFLLSIFAVFDYSYAAGFYNRFRKELIAGAGISFVLYLLMMFFQSQWLALSGTVSILLFKMLSLRYSVNFDFTDVPVLQVGDFTVSIGPPCSGIDSMFLFFAFFTGLYALDYRKLKATPYIILFFIGLVGVFFVNILRLFLLILVGVEISPKIAVGLFHTNAGWIFFLIYFLCYYWVIKKFIYKSKLTGKK